MDSADSSSDLQKRERIMSNKNNALIHELSKKLIAKETSSNRSDKKTPAEPTNEDAKKTQAVTIGKPLLRKRYPAEKKVDSKRRKGMLAFEEESDSDRLFSVFNKQMIHLTSCAYVIPR